MEHEHSYWDEVWVTQVVDEAADVAVIPGIDAIHLPILYRKKKTVKTVEEIIADIYFCYGHIYSY